MPRASPQPGRTIAIIFGASTFPFCAALEASVAFTRSAAAFETYLLHSLRLPEQDILSLFDSPNQPGEQIRSMRSFINRKKALPISEAIFYYCGHGAYLSEDEYVLALGCTDTDSKTSTTFRISYLVEVISDLTHDMRNLVLLDACYSGAALGKFIKMAEGGEVDVVAKSVFAGVIDASESEDAEAGGAILFCAAGPRKWAKAPLDSDQTMFTGTVLESLSFGDTSSRLSDWGKFRKTTMDWSAPEARSSPPKSDDNGQRMPARGHFERMGGLYQAC